MIRGFVAGVIALALVAPVLAMDKQPEVVRDIPTFLQKQAELRADIEKSKKYSHVKADAKKKIFAAQDKIEGLLKGHHSIDELNADDKVAVFNSESEIVAQLDEADADRMICTNEARTGSHLPTVSCTTQRDRDKQREAVRNTYQSLRPSCGAACSAR